MARKLGIYVAPIMLALAMTPASAALAITRSAAPGACTNWVHMTSPDAGTGDNDLYGVAATSPDNAWAVGEYFTGVDTKTLTEHWNGKSWKVVPSPNPGPDNLLQAVYAASATSVWAVGSYFNGTAGRTLIEHWNGKSWKVVPSPNIGSGSNEFVSVRGTSASNIWAAGDAVTSYPVTKNLIVHWDGSHWRVVSSPSVPNSPNFLASVRPQSRTTGWAVGRYVHGSASRTLILRWSKGKWRIVPSPNAGSGTNALRGVVASSPTSSWAVGDYYNGTADKTLILHWNGRQWARWPSPNAGNGTSSNDLGAIGGTSAANIYSVGQTFTGTSSQALLLHWNGTHWRTVPAKNPGTVGNGLDALYALSPASIWAVGSYNNGGFNRTLIERCS